MLPKGDACFRCRDYKLKCNGARPTCARCQRLNKECGYAPGVAKRRSKNMMLEQRALELELKVQQLSLVSTHNLLIASVRLLERIGRMNNAQVQLPLKTRSQTPVKAQKIKSEVSTPEIGALDKNRTEHIISAILDHVRDARPSSGFEDLPPYLAHHLLSLFLPYHRHFYFFTNVPYFLACVSLPPSHPEAIHPCLLNACYLAACVAGGKAYADLQPYFIMRTRHFLDEALMFADRIMHFLWASMLLGNCLARSRRMQEWYTVVSSAAQFASACGLRLTHTPDGVPKPDDACRDEALLPPPKDEAEAIDRIRLAHSIYITDQSMTTLTALPQTFSWDMWPGNTTQRPPRSKSLEASEGKGSKKTCSDVQLMAATMKIYEEANKFARLLCANGYRGYNEEYVRLKDQISLYHDIIPSIPDPEGLDAAQAAESLISNILVLVAHATLYGSGLIVFSLRAGHDIEAKAWLLKCVRALVDASEKVRAHRRLHPAQAGLLSMVHMMTALRILAHELQRSDTQKDAGLSIHYCEAIEVLLDYVDDTILLYPAWADIPGPVKTKLITAAEAIRRPIAGKS